MKNNILGVLYTTVKNNATAVELVRELLKKNLIACANIFTGVTSLYLWNGEVCEDEEVVIILKTQKNLITSLAEELKKIHPYDVPCIIELEASGIHNHSYLDWVVKETSK